MAGTGIGTFNDRLRDAVRGGGPFDADPRRPGLRLRPVHRPQRLTRPTAPPAEQKARLLHYQDLIKVGPDRQPRATTRSPTPAASRSTGSRGRLQRLPRRLRGRPRRRPHLRRRARQRDPVRRARLQAARRPPRRPTGPGCRSLALATAALSQGTGALARRAATCCAPSRWTATPTTPATGSTRSTGTAPTGNGFGRGLPPAADNEAKWPYAKPLLADPALVPDCAAIEPADAGYARAAADPVVLAGRSRSAPPAEVQKRLSFPPSGASETPGVLTMHLDARGLDAALEVDHGRLQRHPRRRSRRPWPR